MSLRCNKIEICIRCDTASPKDRSLRQLLLHDTGAPLSNGIGDRSHVGAHMFRDDGDISNVSPYGWAHAKLTYLPPSDQ